MHVELPKIKSPRRYYANPEVLQHFFPSITNLNPTSVPTQSKYNILQQLCLKKKAF